jgi:hypothetical protein
LTRGFALKYSLKQVSGMKLPPCQVSLAVVGLLFLSACDICKETKEEVEQLKKEVATFEKYLGPLPASAVNGAQTNGFSAAVAAVAANAEKRLVLRATADLDASFFTFSNRSYGKFTAQVTVATQLLDGLVSGQSLGFLEWRQPIPVSHTSPRRFYVGAVYDSSINGLRAIVSDTDGNQYGTPIPFTDTAEIDLRIAQTETELLFAARATPTDQSAGGWTTIHSFSEAPDDGFFHVYIGVRNVKKGGRFYFTNFAVDGDAIGGKEEYPIISDLRTCVDNLRASQQKIAASDLTGALTDLDAAILAHTDGLNRLRPKRFALQSVAYAQIAVKTLDKQTPILEAARAAIATNDIAKASAQLKKLEGVAMAEMGAMANLIGFTAPRLATVLKTAPHIFSLRIP